jgi:hypothetical protein
MGFKFINEDTKPVGLTKTNAVKEKSGQSNKDYYKETGKKMSNYDKSVKGEEPVKYSNDKTSQEYHDEFETLNGMEMFKFDNEPSNSFKERAIKAIEGDSKMGNGPGANAEETWGASSDTFGKDLIKRIKKRDKKEKDSQNVITQFGDDIEIVNNKKTKFNKKRVAIGENKTTSKMKRLIFSKPFNGMGNAIKLIPEHFKIDNNTFEMTDGDENYKVRWEGLTSGKPVIIEASSKTMVNEDILKMKNLMTFKSQDTLGTIKGKNRIDENSNFKAIWDKTKNLLIENEEESERFGEDINENDDNMLNDVRSLMDKLDMSVISKNIDKINNPAEKAELLAVFAEKIGVPRAKLPSIIAAIKDTAKSPSAPVEEPVEEYSIKEKNKERFDEVFDDEPELPSDDMGIDLELDSDEKITYNPKELKLLKNKTDEKYIIAKGSEGYYDIPNELVDFAIANKGRLDLVLQKMGEDYGDDSIKLNEFSLFGGGNKSEFMKNYQSLKDGKFIHSGNTTDKNGRQAGIPQQSELIKGAVDYIGGLKLNPTHSNEAEFLKAAEEDKYEGKIFVNRQDKTYQYRNSKNINLGSATAASLNTGAGGMGGK